MSALAGWAAPAQAVDAVPFGHTLVQDKVCLRCHGMVRGHVGPGFAQISARYRDDPAAPARLAAKIRDGSVGTWGRLVMPRQQVSEAESLVLARWVLALPPSP